MFVPEVFFQISAIILLATIISVIVKALKQPLLIAYIITGIVVSPIMANLVETTTIFSTTAQMGIALLLFIIGLHLNPQTIKKEFNYGIVEISILQILLTFLFAIPILMFLNIQPASILYIAIGLTFTSTIVTMKIMYDKRDLGTLHGRIVIGMLLIQDILAAILIMFHATPIQNIAESVGLLTIKGLLVLAILWTTSKYLFPKIEWFLGNSLEFLLLFSLGWCFAIASLFEYLGFSIEIGALLAGIALSSSPLHYEIASRISPLRDFFIILFFIYLGAQINPNTFLNVLPTAAILSLFVLFIKPLIVMSLLGAYKYSKKTLFLSGIYNTNISEFSLILATLGMRFGYAERETLSLLTVTAIITISISTYLMLYGQKIYPRISRFLRIFERKGKKIDEYRYTKDENYKIIIFGFDRIGFSLLKTLKNLKEPYLIVDQDPEKIIELSKKGIECKFGDASDIEFLQTLNLKSVRMVISTIPDLDTNLFLIKQIRNMNKDAIIIVVAHRIDDALELYKNGATYVLMPHFLGGSYIASIIEKYKFDAEKFLKEQLNHLKELQERKKIRHEHPSHRK